MFDKFRLKDALVQYKKDFVTMQWGNEKYKWEAVKCFQDNWDVNAEDFADMIAKADNMHKIKFTPNNVAYIYTAQEDLENGEAAHSVSRKMVGLMRDIKGVYVWANFTESDDGVLTELRSNRCNINPVAVKYGGGGHKKASGCVVKDRAEAMRLLADLDAVVAEYKAE